jgi:hypothetical protein
LFSFESSLFPLHSNILSDLCEGIISDKESEAKSQLRKKGQLRQELWQDKFNLILEINNCIMGRRTCVMLELQYFKCRQNIEFSNNFQDIN